MKLLLAEDDPVLADGIIRAFSDSFSIDAFTTVEQTRRAFLDIEYDIVLLDLGLSDGDSTLLIKEVRAKGILVPIIIVTAKDMLFDKIHGLDSGADDYLVKPFELSELEARVRALLRRRYLALQSEICIGTMRYDQIGRRLFINDEEVELLSREIEVLETLLASVDKVVSKEHLMDRLTSIDEEIGANAIEVYIHRLRKKLAPSKAEIKTIRGLGYMIIKEYS